MNIKKYDTVLLKDGREATIVEAFDGYYIADVGSGPDDLETIDVYPKDIEQTLHRL